MQQRFAIALPPTSQTANCLQQRFAIASPHPPKSDRTLSNFPTSFFNEPQRHRGHRERAIAPPSTPKQRSHPLNSPNSELLAAALRYRTSSTPKQRSHSLQPPKSDRIPSNFPTSFLNEPQRHRGHRETAIAPPQLPKQRSHPLNSLNSDRIPSTLQTAIAPPQLPKQRSHPLQLPKHSFFNEPQRRRERRGRISHFHPASFFNKPRRPEEHEGRREERAIAHLTPSIVR